MKNLISHLEVFHGLHSQLQRRILIADHQRVGMLLECTNGPHVIHAFFDR